MLFFCWSEAVCPSLIKMGSCLF